MFFFQSHSAVTTNCVTGSDDHCVTFWRPQRLSQAGIGAIELALASLAAIDENYIKSNRHNTSQPLVHPTANRKATFKLRCVAKCGHTDCVRSLFMCTTSKCHWNTRDSVDAQPESADEHKTHRLLKILYYRVRNSDVTYNSFKLNNVLTTSNYTEYQLCSEEHNTLNCHLCRALASNDKRYDE